MCVRRNDRAPFTTIQQAGQAEAEPEQSAGTPEHELSGRLHAGRDEFVVVARRGKGANAVGIDFAVESGDDDFRLISADDTAKDPDAGSREANDLAGSPDGPLSRFVLFFNELGLDQRCHDPGNRGAANAGLPAQVGSRGGPVALQGREDPSFVHLSQQRRDDAWRGSEHKVVSRAKA